ncbi:HAD-IIA family hydrolase [Epibacterium ulvae]|nr:HAD-IIA family hydrolase [Epibacterium ulvae]
MTPAQAFARYEAIRPRLPNAGAPGAAQKVASLAEVSALFDAFVFDAYGVLNVGDQPVPGARQRIDALRDAGKQVIVLTNAASFTRLQTDAKFKRLGFDFSPAEIVSSREVCEQQMTTKGTWGVMAPDGFQTDELSVKSLVLEDQPDAYRNAAGFLLLSTAGWTAKRHDLLCSSLKQNPRPIVVANPDLVAPREDGLSLEPGFYAQDLQDKLGCAAEFHGKPFPSVYDEVERRLSGIAPARVAMVGDTLHTDILGAQSRGWGSVLVTDHGLFAGLDVGPFITQSGIIPDWIVPTI